jgi:hypothetical protein
MVSAPFSSKQRFLGIAVAGAAFVSHAPVVETISTSWIQRSLRRRTRRCLKRSHRAKRRVNRFIYELPSAGIAQLEESPFAINKD